MSIVNKILRNDLCLGCGLCEAVDKAHCSMRIDENGFYRPEFDGIPVLTDTFIRNACPGIRIKANNGNRSAHSIWGNVEKVVNAWASDVNIRKSSSSGGVTSSLAIYLLESGQVDGVLHVGTAPDTYLYNKLFVSRTREDILKRNSSRYAPAAVFNDIFRILETTGKETFAFIGKPCDVAALQNVIRLVPRYAGRIKFFLSIFCAGMPSYEATRKALRTFGKDEEPVALRYRGDGWPGFFKATYSDGTECKMTYNDSWGKILGKQLGFRCKICPDGIGMLADIASGDSWNTKDGYPDFTEGNGRNFCFIRNEKGKLLFDAAVENGYVVEEELDVNEVKTMQAYQYKRRHYVGWRILAVQIITRGLLRFNGLGYAKTAIRAKYVRAVRDMAGTIKRLYKVRHKN